jgi:CheY-like chemotaxis protein
VDDTDSARLRGHLHDVSNVLTVVLGWAEEARRSMQDPIYVERALGVIEAEARRARSLSRRAIGAEGEGVPTDVRTLLRELTAALGPRAKAATVELVVDAFDSSVVAGADDLYHAVSNLVHNALSFAPPGSKVTVSCDVGEHTVVVTVSDQGSGVPAALRSSIFAGTSARAGGAGVGLRHARNVAELNGGTLWLAPSELGARFCIEWPVHVVTPPPRSSVAAPPALAALRILVLEDDAGVRSLLEAALEARGAQVVLAATLDQVWQTTGEFDAMILDLSPLGRDPEASAAKLRAKLPKAHALVATGSADSMPAALLDATVVRKPFEVAEIVNALMRAVAFRL